MEYSYISWIPTVAGRLSYRHIGNTNNSGRSFYENAFFDNEEGGSRIILGFQERDLSDAYFKTFIHYIFGLTGDFLFAFACTNKSADMEVEGELFIFVSDEKKKKYARSVLKYNIDCLRGAKSSLIYNSGLESLGDAKFHLSDSCDISISFCLERTGEIRFSQPEFRDTKLKLNTLQYADENNSDFNKWLADQAYFFIRDMTHTHQHHANSTDTIITTQHITAIDSEWRKNIIYSLYYHAISLKRRTSYIHLVQAEGILAYAESFIGISKDKNCDIPPYQSHALLNSINAKIKQHDAVIQNENSLNSKVTLFLTYILPSLAIVFTILSPILSNVSNNPRLLDLRNFIENIYTAIIVTTISALVSLAFGVPAFVALNKTKFMNERRQISLYFASLIFPNKTVLVLMSFTCLASFAFLYARLVNLI